MAKSMTKKTEDKVAFTTPSRYGSHAAMIDNEQTEQLKDKNLVVLKDDAGSYVTERKRLDSGGADPNRYSLQETRIYSLEKALNG